MRKLLESTAEAAIQYLEKVDERKVLPAAEAVDNLELFREALPEKTKRVIAGIQQDGTCYCGGTVWQGQEAMRISVSSWATTEEDVEKSLTAMLRIADNIE